MSETVKMTSVKPPQFSDWEWLTRNLTHVPVVTIGPRQPKPAGLSAHSLAKYDVYMDGERIGSVDSVEETRDRRPRGLTYATSRTHGIGWAFHPAARRNEYAYSLTKRQRNEAVYALAIDELRARK